MDCVTELCLGLAGGCHRTSSDSAGSTNLDWVQRCGGETPQFQQQHITVVYGGRAFVFDPTDVQARAIICMAKRDIDEMVKRRNCCQNEHLREWTSPTPPPSHPLQLQPLNPGFSLKRSLQRFLQERRSRTRAATHPYPQTRPCS